MLVLLLTWILSALALYITAMIVPSFSIKTFGTAMWAVVIIGFFNMLLRPILLFLTIPINILTLGLFTFVVNAMILKLSAKFLTNFVIKGWGSAILGAVVLVLVQAGIQYAINTYS